ncbi:MAG: PKD domain-containing protein [Chloroflexi bacterium]|nr:PKD domain-containing protein [Chloroflexota bacterium]MCI0644737.1 PKD domain-containing protein [Chloroflexota bacterium]MCI0728642.1 PKD domain-containing protein [Chloroflexota bacterium]
MKRYRLAWLLALAAGLALLAGWLGLAAEARAAFVSPKPGQPALAGDARLTGDLTELPLLNQAGGAVNAVTRAGSYSYIGHGPRVVVLDTTTNPAEPQVIGYSSPLDAVVSDLFQQGSILYALGGGNLTLLNVSNPASPMPVGFYDTPGVGVNIVVSGTLAYIAERQIWTGTTFEYGGLRILDVSDPTNPVELGYFDSDGSADAVAVLGNYAYLGKTSGTVEVVVLNVSNPANPVEVNDLNTNGSVRGLALANNYLYVAQSSQDLTVYSLANPAAPAFAGNYVVIGTPGDLTVDNDRAYVTAGTAGVRILNVADPANISEVAAYDVPGPEMAVRVSTGSGQVQVAYHNLGLRLINPNDASLLGVYEYLSYPASIGAAGGYIYLTDAGDGLRVLDLADPLNPTPAGIYPTAAPLGDFVIEGSYLYLAAGFNGLWVLDLGNPLTPTLLGSYNSPDIATDVVLSSTVAYLNDNSGGLRLVNVANPAMPTELGFYDPGSVDDVAVTGHYAAVAAGSNGLRLVDVANPSTPTEVGFYATTNDADAVAVYGNYAYLAEAVVGIHVLDISNPMSPTLMATLPLTWTFASLDVINDQYLAALGSELSSVGPGNMMLYDLNNAAAPDPVGYGRVADRAQDVLWLDNRFYLATGPSGLHILGGLRGVVATNDSPTALGSATTLTATVYGGGGPYTITWTFGDGGQGSGAVANHTYASAGQYTAVAVASSVTETFTATTTVFVQTPVSGLAATSNSPTTLGSTTFFTASITAGDSVNYQWEFGDGGQGSGMNTSHTYAAIGVYTATVTATNAVSSATATTVVTVVEPGWTVYLPLTRRN